MPLNTSAAESVGSAIAAAISALPRGQNQTEEAWKIIITKIFQGIVANAKVTIPASSVVTTGGPATQTGPSSPLDLTIT